MVAGAAEEVVLEASADHCSFLIRHIQVEEAFPETGAVAVEEVAASADLAEEALEAEAPVEIIKNTEYRF